MRRGCDIKRYAVSCTASKTFFDPLMYLRDVYYLIFSAALARDRMLSLSPIMHRYK